MEQIEELGGDAMDIRLVSKDTAKDAASRQVCPHCGAEQLKITLDKPTTFREDGHKLTPKEVRERLERIPDDDLVPLGHRPRFLPSGMDGADRVAGTAGDGPAVITLESGDRSEDDLTHKLVDVLRINQRLRENRDAGAPQLIVEDLWELLQYHVTTYFDNQTSRHSAGEAPLRPPVEDAGPEAEGQGGTVPFQPVG